MSAAQSPCKRTARADRNRHRTRPDRLAPRPPGGTGPLPTARRSLSTRSSACDTASSVEQQLRAIERVTRAHLAQLAIELHPLVAVERHALHRVEMDSLGLETRIV